MKPILKNSENVVYVDDNTDISSGSYPVIVKNIATGKEKPVKDVQILFKFGVWEEIDSEPNKAKFVMKGGTGSGDFDHKGRPGQVGGSSSNPKDTITQSYLETVSKLSSQSVEAMVLEHGQSFTPQQLPKGYKRGKAKLCFMNAYQLADANPELTYVEGFAVPDFIDLPIQHAWAVDKDGNVVDNTWKTPGVSYYGIPFKTDFVRKVISKTGTYGVLGYESREFFKNGMPEDAIYKERAAMEEGALTDVSIEEPAKKEGRQVKAKFVEKERKSAEVEIVIEDHENDDWMKSLPGYKNEAAIIASLKKDKKNESTDNQ